MKLFNIIILSLVSFATFSQDSTLLKKRYYRATIITAGNAEIKGWLTDITDTTVSISNLETPFRPGMLTVAAQQPFSFSQIDKLQVKRKNGGARGLAIGLTSGFAAGAIIGLISGDDTSGWFRLSAGEKAMAAGIGLGITGGVIGVLVGSLARKTFIIKGRKEKLQAARVDVLEQAYRKPAAAGNLQ